MAKLPADLGALYKGMHMALADGVDVDTAELDARIILECRADKSYLDILTAPETVIQQDQLTLIAEDVARRIAGEPIAKIYGVKEFWGREFKVSTDVLDPRPDTESIIDAILTWHNANESQYGEGPLRVVDIGTGTGCIILTLLAEIPNAVGVAVDYSWSALQIAHENAQRLDLSDRVTFVQGDFVSALNQSVADVIVTNPPYIPSADIANLSESVKNYDPILALDGGNDGLDPYKKIFISLKKNLRTNGHLFLECGYDQIEAITRIGENSGATLERIIYDLGGHARGGVFSCGDK
jgi:release factor glutamine methyltransferase